MVAEGQLRKPSTHALLALAIILLAGCSLRRTAVKVVSDALSGSGGVYATDDDPELVKDAVPFGLKTYEGLLQELPDHEGLLLALASGFTQYAYAFVQDEADRIDASDLEKAREMRARARKLYLRGRDYALRGLEVAHPGFGARLSQDRAAALAMTTKEDVPFLYWAGASWAGALTAAKSDLDLVGDLPAAADLVARALDLDEAWGDGAAHEFFISYEGGRSEAMGGSKERAREHYRRAIELSRGKRASPHLALAESVSVSEQNLKEFRELLDAALAVNPDEAKESRLANTIARRRAQWLRSRIPDLFVDAEEESP